MKKITKYKYIGEILIVIGSFIAIYNLLGFSCTTYGFSTSYDPSGGFSMQPLKTFYYFIPSIRLIIATGFALAIIGILVIKRKNK